jgi:hypothetical protein
MKRKNSFHYTVFVNASGTVEVSGSELLNTFEEDRAVFLMDYADPRTGFTGRISAKVLGAVELERAVQALEMFRGKVSFPSGYEVNLRAAAARGQSPDDYAVEVEAVQ